MKNGIYLLLLILIACTNNQTPKEYTDIIDSTNLTQVEISNPITLDSIHDDRSYYYLSNIPTKDFAELYLKDSIITNDYKKLYDCLDSLSSNNTDTRNYYFKVLMYALDNLEVVFHQSMGIYLVKYIDKFKFEFLVGLSKMKNEQIRFYAQGIQEYLSQTQDKGDKWINNLKLLEKNSTPEQFKKLDLFFKEIELAKSSAMD
jgi:hypothetical protein